MSVEAVESNKRIAMEEEMLAPTVLLPFSPTAETKEEKKEKEKRAHPITTAIPTTPKEAMPQKDKRNFAIYVLKREYSLLVLDIVPPLVWLLFAY